MSEHKRRSQIAVSPQATDTAIWFNLRRHFYERMPVEHVIFNTVERFLVPDRDEFRQQLSKAFNRPTT